jgi:hypothetical protein
MRPLTKGRTLATRLLKLSDAVSFARVNCETRKIKLAQRRLDAFSHALTPDDRREMLAFLDRHDVADSASAILTGGR